MGGLPYQPASFVGFCSELVTIWALRRHHAYRIPSNASSIANNIALVLMSYVSDVELHQVEIAEMTAHTATQRVTPITVLRRDRRHSGPTATKASTAHTI